MKLYVIGNGFDQAHGLLTSYCNYRSFIKERANEQNRWGSILEYYPEGHDFWSDVETNICKIDSGRFLEIKRVFGISDLDLLLPRIRESFEQFIIGVETQISALSPLFELNRDALFISFNYTSTLETVYGIPHDKIIYLHNSVGDAIKKHFFSLPADELVLGHGPYADTFFFYNDSVIGNDTDYIKYCTKTLKNTGEIARKFRLDWKLASKQQEITEVVFYGFSFSPTDQDYPRDIMAALPFAHTKFKNYYFVREGNNEKKVKDQIIDTMMSYGLDYQRIEFINCKGVKRF